MVTDDCVDPCPLPCPSVFDRVVVSRLIAGGTKVSWMLLDTFTDPGPLLFQLQVGNTTNPDAGDWEDVGLPVEDQYAAIDSEQRAFGKANNVFYRVKVTSSLRTVYSDPTDSLGVLNHREWNLARALIRQRRVSYRVGAGSNAQLGYLLKRRITGVRCTQCMDFQTDDTTDPSCPMCYGTGYQCGYYYPAGCVWAAIQPRFYRTQRDDMRGTIRDTNVRAEMIATDILDEEDVWVNKKTDDRYYIHEVQHISEMRGVPLVVNVSMSLIPYSSVIYRITIPDQLAALE